MKSHWAREALVEGRFSTLQAALLFLACAAGNAVFYLLCAVAWVKLRGAWGFFFG